MTTRPAALLKRFWPLLRGSTNSLPVLDLACGDGHNGVFLAGKGISVICCDQSSTALSRARETAGELGLTIRTWELDLEQEGTRLPAEAYGGILVFRYLHRPLIPSIRKALTPGGILLYETFTVRQPDFGKPHNPDFLLNPGELLSWFTDWQIIHSSEGVRRRPQRAVAQLVCQKP